MNRILGIGSPFGADQLGWIAIDMLLTCHLPNSELIKLDRPGSALLDYFRGVNRVILIDAVEKNIRPGCVGLVQVEQLDQVRCLTSSHGFGVAEAVALASQLGELPPELHLIGIQTGMDISQVPAFDAPALESLVRELI
ncbi:MAG: hydrogenase maturation protease [Candidatus Thiodiazotropha sp. (ex Codakia rugifera)]|nr:hydrogenase maturation protease [Candidatus Thiodiazotropha sp. (ex Codakia rugifera)]